MSAISDAEWEAMGFSIHWPVEGTEIRPATLNNSHPAGFSIHWPVEGTEIVL